MPNNPNEINIVIRWRNELSSALDQASGSVNRFGKEIDQAGRHVQQFGSKLALVGGVITGSYIAAIKTATDVSIPAYEAMLSFETTLRELQVTIVEAALPALQQIASFIQSITNAFNTMDPEIRNAIVQWTFLGGAALVASGLILKLAGALTSVVGKLVLFLTHLNPISIAIGVAALATWNLILYWDKVRQYVLPIVNAFEIGCKTVAVAILYIADAALSLPNAFEGIRMAMLNFIGMVETAFPAARIFSEKWREAVMNMQFDTDNARAQIEASIQTLTESISQAFTTGQGQWSQSLDSAMTSAQSFIQSLYAVFQGGFAQIDNQVSTFMLHFQQGFAQSFAKATDLGTQSFAILKNQVDLFSAKFGQGFAEMIVHGKNFGESMKQMFLDMAEAFIAQVARMIAEWAAFMTMRAAFAFLGFHTGGMVMHSGGPVQKAHSGMAINSDEVPILAQTGEGILSRRGMAALGGPDILGALNAGRTMNKSVLISIEINNPVIQDKQNIDDLVSEIDRRIARGSAR